jgi:cyclic beta-1,2-glucan synthetase
LDAHAWAGDRYLRAFWDDGSAMGGSGNEPCSIDLLPQAFASLCGMPDPARRNAALSTALALLADPEHRLVRLLREPFPHSGKRAGYINAYPPGIRENGGQYTHAAVWLCLALLRENRAEEAWALLRLLNPAELSEGPPEALARYRGEPYALAGDVSGAPGSEGQAGWTHYTGAAAWFYRTVVEGMLGLREEDGQLLLDAPCLPEGWKGHVRVKLTHRDGTTTQAEG